MFDKKKIIAIILLVVAFLAFQFYNNEEDLPEVETRAFMMDTIIDIQAHGHRAEEAVEAVEARISEIEYLMSKTIEESEIYQLNNNPGQKIELSPETLEVLKRAFYFAEETDGAFDPTIAALVNLWGIGTENARVPSQREIEEAMEYVDYNYLEISDNTAQITKEGVELDLGGIAKAYAGDEVKKVFSEYGVESAFVNLGGDVVVIGNKVDGTNWRIGIQDPRAGRGDVMAIVDSKDLAIITSGNYERYFEEDGVLYHHIIDPETGYPTDNNIISTTVFSENAMDADALATGIFVMGLEAGMDYIESKEEYEVKIITADLDVYLSSGAAEIIEITSDDFRVVQN